MKLEIEIVPDLEDQLQQAANHAGIEPRDYVTQVLQQNLNQYQLSSRSKSKQLSASETELFQRINRSLTAAQWKRYHDLQDKREAEDLTQDIFLMLTNLHP